MKLPFIIASVLLISFTDYSQNDSKLPATWAKDLVIEFSHTGSMDGSETTGRITYDSCIFNHQSGHKKPVKGFYKMKAADRQAILKRLNDLKADQIKGEASPVAVNDGWSELIRIGDLWMSGGSSIEMTEENSLRFGQVYRYLEEFAITKTRAQ